MIKYHLIKSLIKADTSLIDNKHTGKYVSNLTYDTGLITNLLSTAILNLFKELYKNISKYSIEEDFLEELEDDNEGD